MILDLKPRFRKELYIISNNELIQVKANKFSVGLSIKKEVNKFTNNELPLHGGDCLYIFSDGYADQIGGETGDSKFMYNRFRELQLNIHRKEMDVQVQLLDETLLNWRKGVEQLDDIMVIGIRV